MQDHGARLESLLWQNEDQSLILIDGPTSIAEAQFLGKQRTLRRQLISCPPQDSPFPAVEPKSAEARANVQKRQTDANIHDTCARRSNIGLQILYDSYGRDKPYCLPRAVTSPAAGLSLKRKITSSTKIDLGSGLLEAVGSDQYQQNDLDESIWVNEQVLMPPRSAFLLGDCADTSSFRSAVRDYLEDRQSRRFDFILLDPPWPNSSPKRSGGYRPKSTIRGIKQLLVGMDLDAHVAANGFIAIWITNRPAVRELVLGKDGLFEIWNVEFAEEWTWLKVTQNGEPILPIDGLWRKPYETLLIGKAPQDRMMLAAQGSTPKCRLLVSVPDLHSRKPCLKEVFQQYLLNRQDGEYNAVEIFARYLVAGWLSWGDEAVKFNLKQCWREPLAELDETLK